MQLQTQHAFVSTKHPSVTSYPVVKRRNYTQAILRMERNEITASDDDGSKLRVPTSACALTSFACGFNAAEACVHTLRHSQGETVTIGLRISNFYNFTLNCYS